MHPGHFTTLWSEQEGVGGAGGYRLLFESRGWGFDDGDRKKGGDVCVSGGEGDSEKGNCEKGISFVNAIPVLPRIRIMEMCYSVPHVPCDPKTLFEESKEMSKLPAKLRNQLKKEAFAWEASLSEERPEKVEKLLERAEVFQANRLPRSILLVYNALKAPHRERTCGPVVGDVNGAAGRTSASRLW